MYTLQGRGGRRQEARQLAAGRESELPRRMARGTLRALPQRGTGSPSPGLRAVWLGGACLVRSCVTRAAPSVPRVARDAVEAMLPARQDPKLVMLAGSARSRRSSKCRGRTRRPCGRLRPCCKLWRAGSTASTGAEVVRELLPRRWLNESGGRWMRRHRCALPCALVGGRPESACRPGQLAPAGLLSRSIPVLTPCGRGQVVPLWQGLRGCVGSIFGDENRSVLFQRRLHLRMSVPFLKASLEHSLPPSGSYSSSTASACRVALWVCFRLHMKSG